MYCYGNQLTSLNVSNNIALEDLDCQRNQLTSLDASGCIALTTLYCYRNQLTSLDVSDNTSLISLECNSNQLINLNISKNYNLLSSLSCIWDSCTYGFLDLSNMPTLNEVCVWEMPFPPEDKVELVDTTGSLNVYFTTECAVNIPIKYTANSTINIYPNPSDGIINIEIENLNNTIIEIYNVSGRLASSKEINSKVERIDISGFPKGIYVVKVMHDSAINVSKVVVR